MVDGACEASGDACLVVTPAAAVKTALAGALAIGFLLCMLTSQPEALSSISDAALPALVEARHTLFGNGAGVV